jgi:hypothetical protein
MKFYQCIHYGRKRILEHQVYISVVLGNWSLVEGRSYLMLAGLLSIAMGIVGEEGVRY